ncbi:protein FATTY ACID EXPORT 6-like isoform X1 [Malus sylvestris]|uniref:protein FATTY ACID EXPORT 6-like isoform X1 n=1 Tax=Malus domestica TaxID=3750 RepID=UPI0007EC5C65|nr:protein FATTY ACID EXPORT 6-like isoform X1 [Malus domestica]XP_050109205.1 protein FATTY ACID EXPORT 6-like isoform X1 [Malus sylvestris]
MHDFCFTIPYGLVLIGGGVFGYFKKGSTASLAGGAGIGLLLTLAGYISLKAFEKKKNSYPALILETVCAALLTWVMGQRYLHTFKIMPAGVVAGISAQERFQILCVISLSGVRSNLMHPRCHDWILCVQNCNGWKPYSGQDQVMVFEDLLPKLIS